MKKSSESPIGIQTYNVSDVKEVQQSASDGACHVDSQQNMLTSQLLRVATDMRLAC